MKIIFVLPFYFVYLTIIYVHIFEGKSKPRQTDKPLPTPVDVTNALKYQNEKAHESATALLGAWSELLLHDLASTGNLKNPDCCTSDSDHDECYGHISSEECKDYMRSIPVLDEDSCTFGKITSPQ